jgi:hypothetical protein
MISIVEETLRQHGADHATSPGDDNILLGRHAFVMKTT